MKTVLSDPWRLEVAKLCKAQQDRFYELVQWTRRDYFPSALRMRLRNRTFKTEQQTVADWIREGEPES